MKFSKWFVRPYTEAEIKKIQNSKKPRLWFAIVLVCANSAINILLGKMKESRSQGPRQK